MSCIAGKPYFTYNPDLFDSSDCWKFTDMQQLCVKLGLGGRGTREQLLQRLRQWHRDNSHDPSRVASNFALLGVQVFAEQPDTASPKPAVSPRFLSPLVRRRRAHARTPILKQQRGECTPVSAKRLAFSPFNMVRLIPHRADMHYPPRWAPPTMLDMDDAADDVDEARPSPRVQVA